MPFKPFQQRVITERLELDDKRQKLDTFVHGEAFQYLDDAERDRMSRQLAAMNDYSAILRERIAAFSGGVIDVPATDPTGYMASGKREPTATALSPGEAAHIEFNAGRRLAAAGGDIDTVRDASDEFRNGYQYERSRMQAAAPKPVDAAASHE